MYSFKEGLLPSVFKNMFSLTSQIHSYNTRNFNAFFLFPARTNIRLFAILRFQGPKFFNSLNLNIQSTATISLFKSRLKAYPLS